MGHRTSRHSLILAAFLWLLIAVLACSQGNAPVLYVTATAGTAFPSPHATFPNPFIPTATPSEPTATAIQPTPNPTYPPTALTTSYTLQPGDSLATIADEYGTTVDQILNLNAGLTETTPIVVGQVITLPGRPSRTTPNVKLIPDSELINSPAVSKFDLFEYAKEAALFTRLSGCLDRCVLGIALVRDELNEHHAFGTMRV